MMSVVLGSSNFVDALCYLDDILVWGETWEVFMKRLKKILEKVEKAGTITGSQKMQVWGQGGKLSGMHHKRRDGADQ